jgi:hypothetical protein
VASTISCALRLATRVASCLALQFVWASLVPIAAFAQTGAAAQVPANAKPPSPLAVPIAYSLESVSLKNAKAVFDGTVWKVDADGLDAEGARRFNVEHRQFGAALYLNVTEAERVAGFEIDRVLASWFDGSSKYKATKIDVPRPLKIDPSWRCTARSVNFTGDIEKTMLLCMQARGRTTVDFMLGLPKTGWDAEAMSINSAIASIIWR